MNEPVAWICEYGAVSLPLGHSARISSMEIFATEAEAVEFGEECEYDYRVMECHIPRMALPLFKAIA